MAKKAESRLVKRILRALRKRGGWWYKVWGGPFTPEGIPDLVGCENGLFFALEVKRPSKDSKPSALQLETIKKIAWNAGGVSTVVRSPEEAVDVANQAAAQAARGTRVRARPKKRRSVSRAKNR